MEEPYKKSLNELDKHDDAVSHLELDILEYEFKWALGRITMNKASGGEAVGISPTNFDFSL